MRLGTVGHCDIVLSVAYISGSPTEVDRIVHTKRTTRINVVADLVVGIAIGPDNRFGDRKSVV